MGARGGAIAVAPAARYRREGAHGARHALEEAAMRSGRSWQVAQLTLSVGSIFPAVRCSRWQAVQEE